MSQYFLNYLVKKSRTKNMLGNLKCFKTNIYVLVYSILNWSFTLTENEVMVQRNKLL
jgi:hypothetical protein